MSRFENLMNQWDKASKLSASQEAASSEGDELDRVMREDPDVVVGWVHGFGLGRGDLRLWRVVAVAIYIKKFYMISQCFSKRVQTKANRTLQSCTCQVISTP